MNNQIQLVLKSSTTELSLNDRELGIYLTPELDGLTGLPEIRTTSGVNAGYDGGWTSAQNYDARSITIRGVIANENVATVEQLRRQLTTLAGQGKNEELTLDLVTQGGKAYTIQVRTIALEMALQKVLCQQEFMLQLRADDPLIYDGGSSGESVIVQVQKAIGGFQINFELPLAISGGSGESTINNGGLEQVYPIIKMYGALHNPTFVNQTTNQQFEVNATLGFAEGAWHTPSELYEGTTINVPDAPDNAPLASFQLDGETSQNGTPTPDAPIPVKTVTGENVVKICGKNLFDSSATPDYVAQQAWAYFGNGTYTAITNGYYFESGYRAIAFEFDSLTVGQQYTLSFDAKGNSSHNAQVGVNMYSGASGGTQKNYTIETTSARISFTFTATSANRIAFNSGSTSGADLTITNIQLELGSTATAYEPYQGHSYPISLGSIELCKIGTYQDYIYKSGDKWYIHKECEHRSIAASSRSGIDVAQTNTARVNYGTILSSKKPTTAVTGYMNYAVAASSSNWSADNVGFYWDGGNGGFWVRFLKSAVGSTAEDVDSFLSDKTFELYYTSATPTDTEITNEALIDQLEAVLAARTYYGTNNITTITPNEQGTLEISYMTEKDADKRDVMVIDSRMRTVTLNGADIYHLIAAGSEFPMLAPGENKLLLRSDTPGDNGYADVNYKQGYLTI